MQNHCASGVLVLVAVLVLPGCYVRVPVENPVPITLAAKSGRPDPAAIQCSPPPSASPAAETDRAQARRLNDTGLEHARAGDIAQARTVWLEAARLDPSNAAVAFNLAQAHEDLGEDGAAFNEYCRYLALSPNASDAGEIRERLPGLFERPFGVSPEAASFFRVGTGFARQGEVDRAKEAYDRAADAAPNWADLRFNRALVLESLQEHSDAADELRRYLALRPNAPDRALVEDKINALEVLDRGTRKLAWGRTFLFSGAVLFGGYTALFCFVIAPEECP